MATAVTQPFGRAVKRSHAAISGGTRSKALKDITGVPELTQNVGLTSTGDFVAWCEHWSHYHDEYMVQRERLPSIKQNSARPQLYKYLSSATDEDKEALLQKGPDELRPIEHTLKLILQVAVASKNQAVQLGPFPRDLPNEYWHRIWQSIKFLSKAKVATDQGKQESRWELLKTKESAPVQPLPWMTHNAKGGDTVTQPGATTVDFGDNRVFRPSVWKVYWENQVDYQSLTHCPSAVQDLPDPRRFVTPQGFRDQVRALYHMQDLELNIRRLVATITPRVPFDVGPPTQSLKVGESWSDILWHCNNEEPSAIKWTLITQPLEKNECLYEEIVPQTIQSIITVNEEGNLSTVKSLTKAIAESQQPTSVPAGMERMQVDSNNPVNDNEINTNDRSNTDLRDDVANNNKNPDDDMHSSSDSSSLSSPPPSSLFNKSTSSEEDDDEKNSEEEESHDEDGNAGREQGDNVDAVEYPVPDIDLGNFDADDAAQVTLAQTAFVQALWNDYDIVRRRDRRATELDAAKIAEIITQETSGKELSTEAERAEFRKFQQSRINPENVGIEYRTACAILDIDPVIRLMDGITVPLKPHQISGLVWMARQEEGCLFTWTRPRNWSRQEARDAGDRMELEAPAPTEGGILGDDPGLGKTLLCISLMVQRLGDHVDGDPYRPTLVLAPAQLLLNWVEELQRYAPGLIVVLFWGSNNGTRTDDIRMSNKDISAWPNDPDLVSPKFAYLFDENNPDAARTVIVSAYSTWARRTLIPAESFEGENEHLSHPDISRFNGNIHRLFLDEGHLAKNPQSLIHRSIVTIEARYRWIVTATPLINRTDDIVGLLKILWRPDWQDCAPEQDEDDEEAEFDPFNNFNNRPRSDIVRRLVLNPAVARRMLNTAIASDSGDIDLVQLRQKLPAITSQILLRRIFGTKMPGELQAIGSDIPVYTIITVDLQLSPDERREHHTFYHVLAQMFEKRRSAFKDQQDASGKDDEQFKFPFDIWRRLTILSSSVILERLHHAVPSTLSKAIRQWRADGRDYRFLVDRTLFVGDIRPQTKGEELRHLTWGSPKLRYLICVIIPFVVHRLHRKLLVFFDNILTQEWVWYVLSALYFHVEVMHSSLPSVTKSELAARFRDPTSKIQILLCTYKVGGLGLNLHEACSHVVLFEAGMSTAIEIQGYGRTRRQGQTQPQLFWRLFQIDSINGYQEYRQLEKMRGEISGWNDRTTDQILEDLLDADSNKDLTNLTTLERAIDLYHAKLMGQKYPRSGYRSVWRSMRQSKDEPMPDLPEEPVADVEEEPAEEPGVVA